METTPNVETTTTQTNVVNETPTPKTLVEQLNELYVERKNIAAKQNVEGITDVEFDLLENERFEIKRKIDSVKQSIESEANRLKHENELNDYLFGLITPFIQSIIAYNGIVDHANPNENEKTVIAEYNVVYGKLKNELTDRFNNVKRIIHVPMGTTGSQLVAATTPKQSTPNETSKNAQLKKMMSEGKSNDELIKLGYLDGTVRYARWEYNKTLKQNGK